MVISRKMKRFLGAAWTATVVPLSVWVAPAFVGVLVLFVGFIVGAAYLVATLIP